MIRDREEYPTFGSGDHNDFYYFIQMQRLSDDGNPNCGDEEENDDPDLPIIVFSTRPTPPGQKKITENL